MLLHACDLPPVKLMHKYCCDHISYKQYGNTIIGNTVEPLYNGHFGTSHFWVIFAVILFQR